MTWYKEGLKFKCTECGKCCTGSPGGVFVTMEEISAMADFLGCTREVFIASFTRRENGRLCLIDRPKNYDCVFLKDKKCQVYAARPKQCRTFPWWKENLESWAAWKNEKQRCEGFDHPEGQHFSKEEIDAKLSQ